MTQLLSRRHFLSLLTASLGTAGCAQAPETSLRPFVRPNGLGQPPDAGALIAEAGLGEGGRVGFAVMDVASGRLLEQSEGRAGLPPASVTKSVTALYALNALGAGHRFATRLIATGSVSNGRLNGDLVLAGSGDPTLDTDALAGLAAQLKAAGVREVTGRLRTWSGALPFVREIDREQNDYVAYNASVSGLNLNFNRVHFEWKRGSNGYTTTMDARSSAHRPEVSMARMRIVERDTPLFAYTDGGDHEAWSVSRKALGNAGSRWLPVRKPDLYAAEVFATFARAQGIPLKRGDPVRSAPQGSTLATHRSVPLRDILRDMLRFSNNMTAEAVGLTATAARSGAPASLKASAQGMTAWARDTLGMRGASFVDHSGLGAASRVTAGEMASAMVAVARQDTLKPILRPFAMRHDNGKVNDAHPVKVVAKTGTLFFVSSLSGYMTAPDGRELAFAIFTVNDRLRGRINRQTGARPEGSASWNKRSKRLQQRLIERWGQAYGG